MRAYRCSVAAELGGDPLEGTAPPADHWLLVEHAGPWGRHAITESKVHPAAAAAFAAWTRTHRARVALIRRPGAAHRTRRSGRWFRADARPGHEGVRTGVFAHEAQLADVLADPGAGEPSDEPVYLVCTHGRHDTCCALRGRPVAHALATAYPDRTWECTHVGGDRFAANLVVLPHGLYYGQVAPGDALDLVKRHEAGALDLGRLRGRSSLPAPVQAAQHHARLASGDTSIDGHPPLAVERPAAGLWRVTLAGPGQGRTAVTLRAVLRDVDRPLTCKGAVPDRFHTFELVGLEQQRR